jgi:hypothetical protein
MDQSKEYVSRDMVEKLNRIFGGISARTLAIARTDGFVHPVLHPELRDLIASIEPAALAEL